MADPSIAHVIDGDVSEFIEFDYPAADRQPAMAVIGGNTASHYVIKNNDGSNATSDAQNGLTTIAVPLQQSLDGKQMFILMPSNFTLATAGATTSSSTSYTAPMQPQLFVNPPVGPSTSTTPKIAIKPGRRVSKTKTTPTVPIVTQRKPAAPSDDDDDVELRIPTPDLPEPKEPKVKVVRALITYTCQLCDYTSTKRYMLKRHMKSHSEDRPHVCAQCSRAFKTASALRNHVDIHDGIKRFPCEKCEMKFVTSGELHRHERYKHSFEKPHQCPLCPFATVETSKLRRHLRMHTGERPYKCDECEYAAADVARLRRHARIHSGERPYVCDVCDAKFAQGNTLKAHKATHAPKTERRMFACPHCDRQLTRATDLKAHVRTLHQSDMPVPCPICKMTFPDRYTMRQHHKAMHKCGEKLMPCPQCAHYARSPRALQDHMQLHSTQIGYKCGRCEEVFGVAVDLANHLTSHDGDKAGRSGANTGGVEQSASELESEEEEIDIDDKPSTLLTRRPIYMTDVSPPSPDETIDAALVLAQLSHQHRRRLGGIAEDMPSTSQPKATLDDELKSSFGFGTSTGKEGHKVVMEVIDVMP